MRWLRDQGGGRRPRTRLLRVEFGLIRGRNYADRHSVHFHALPIDVSNLQLYVASVCGDGSSIVPKRGMGVISTQGGHMKHFLVVGCNRSGTTYTTELFNRLGYRCGHEEVFGVNPPGFSGFGKFDGDVSWLAVPYLDALPSNVLLLHQVRDPQLTIRSIASEGLFRPFSIKYHVAVKLLWAVRRRAMPRPSYYRRFAHKYSPEALTERGEYARAARHWVNWNEAIERFAAASGHQYVRFRVEDIDVQLIHEIQSMLGDEPSSNAAAVIAEMSTTTNQRPRRYDDMETSVLPPELRRKTQALATRYGYDVGYRNMV